MFAKFRNHIELDKFTQAVQQAIELKHLVIKRGNSLPVAVIEQASPEDHPQITKLIAAAKS